MRIISAKIQGFRNLRPAEIVFSPQVNLILGRNGEGKTNLLEALNFMALGRSHRGCRQEELIAFTEESFHLHLQAATIKDELIAFDFGLDRSGSRRIRIDEVKIQRASDLVGCLTTVFFAPDSAKLVRGGPQHRRRFVDRGMAELDRAYLEQLSQFQRVIRQKAGLLREVKSGARSPGQTRTELQAWNRELASQAARICLGRQQYSAFLGPFAAANQAQLTDAAEPLEFRYRPNLESVRRLDFKGTKKPCTEDELAGEIFTEIDYIIDQEIRRGRPLLGPHLDDFEIRLAEIDQRTYGSQGETRTIAISLILAHSDVLFQQRQERPVLFFDDIFSELDRERARRLQEMTSCDHQIFIATARPDDVAGWEPQQIKTWRAQAGELIASEVKT